MTEHPPTLRDLVSQLPEDARYYLEWVANWLVAWEYAERRGWCDGLGSHEYWRLSLRAWAEGLPPSQCSMRLWIRTEANRPPQPQPPKEALSDVSH